MDDSANPTTASGPVDGKHVRIPRLAILLAAAMFVFVIDTMLMNVSISAVVDDLDTTVSGVQAAVATEALVSASFLLIGSKVGDLWGRKRAYVVGLALYAIGALSMVFTQGLVPIFLFWAIVGGLGAALYLPAMQSLIHGNFDEQQRPKVYALVGASSAIAAAVGPVVGGLLTTTISWRAGFLLEAVIIAIVLVGSRGIRDVPYTGDRSVDYVGSILSVVGMGGLVVGVLVWQAGGEAVAALLVVGGAALAGLAFWLSRRKRNAKPVLLDPELFKSKLFGVGSTQIFLQQAALGGLLIVLPIYLQLVLNYNALQAGVTLTPLSLTMFGTALLAGKRSGKRRPAVLVLVGFVMLVASMVILIWVVPRVDSGWYLVLPLVLAGAGFGLIVSQLNNYALSPISQERVGEAAGVTSTAGSFGSSLGLAVAGAVMLAALSIAFTQKSEASDVLPVADQQHIAEVLEDDAQVMSDAQLQEQLASQPADIQEEILRINSEARNLSLQIALLVTLAAAALGIFYAFRMLRLPDPDPSSSVEGSAFG